MLPEALKELDEEDAEVGVGLGGVDPRVQLQEAHEHEDEGVGREATGEDLAGIPSLQLSVFGIVNECMHAHLSRFSHVSPSSSYFAICHNGP